MKRGDSRVELQLCSPTDGSSKRVKELPSDYTILNLESTGINVFSEITEIGMVKVRNNQITDAYQKLVKPKGNIPINVSGITGLSEEDFINAPSIQDVIQDALEFLQKDIIVVHTSQFHIDLLSRCLQENVGKTLENDYFDTLYFARKAYPHFPSHKLEYLCDNIPLNQKKTYRAVSDCYSVFDLLNKCKQTIIENPSLLIPPSLKKPKDYVPGNGLNFDEESPFFNQECVITGTLKLGARAIAFQKIVDIGGHVKGDITNNTRFLIFGTIRSEKEMHKINTAKERATKGQVIDVISEEEFLNKLNNME